jgi:hypothetical protein
VEWAGDFEGKLEGKIKGNNVRCHFSSVVSLFHKGLERSVAMCGKMMHIASKPEMTVFRSVAAHYSPFGEGAGKGRRGFALRGFLALDFQLCDSFPAWDL